MGVILKYKFYILGVLILAGIGYFALTYKVSQVPNLKATPSSSPLATLSNNPATYEVTVVQTGGVSSQVTSVQVVDLTSETPAPLNPSESYVSVSFKSAGDLTPFGGEPSWVGTSNSMWVYCKDGYVVTNAQSPTNNPLDTYLIGMPQYGVGMEVLDKLNNTIQITCVKQ